MPLTPSNASSYACNDLLRNPEYPKTKFQFVLEETKGIKDFPRTPGKLMKATKKLIKSYKTYGGVDLLLRPLLLSMKPNINVKY